MGATRQPLQVVHANNMGIIFKKAYLEEVTLELHLKQYIENVGVLQAKLRLWVVILGRGNSVS